MSGKDGIAALGEVMIGPAAAVLSATAVNAFKHNPENASKPGNETEAAAQMSCGGSERIAC